MKRAVSPMYAMTVHVTQVIRNADNQKVLLGKYTRDLLRGDEEKTKPKNSKLNNGEKICSETEKSKRARINPEYTKYDSDLLEFS